MNYLWTTLTVDNMDESIKFYNELLGLKLNFRHGAGPGMEMAFLGDGETKIELICRSNPTFNNFRAGISIGFQVESLEKTMENLKLHNVSVESEIIEPNPQTRFFFAHDPNGICIQFVENA